MKRISTLSLALIFALALSACAETTGDLADRSLANAQHRSEGITVIDQLPVEELSAGAKQIANVAASPLIGHETVRTELQKEKTASQQNTEVTSAPAESSLISREEATEIALVEAGLTRDAVFDLEAELDKEKKDTFWEVDFETKEFEYSYTLDAATGTVVHREKEKND